MCTMACHLCMVCRETFGLCEEELQECIGLSDQNLAENGLSEGTVAITLKPSVSIDQQNTTAEDSGSSNISKEVTTQPEEGQPLPKRSKLSPGPSPDLSPGRPAESCDQTCCPDVRCVACLGLLEQSYIQHLASVITDQIDRCGLVGMETYHLSIHVPLSVQIRRIGMEMSAKKCKSDSKTEHASENHYVKERLRWQLTKMLEQKLSPLRCDNESPFMINLSLEHRSSLKDCIGLKKQHPKLFPRPKKRRNQPYQPTPITNVPIQRALEVVTEAGMAKEHYFLSPIGVPCTHEVDLQHRSVFVAGRYNKYSRKLPQTPWMVDGVRKAKSSVQEQICPLIVEAFRASDVRFSSSGREDVDVLMLGNGRPFLLELVNPYNVSVSDSDLQEIEKQINGRTDFIAVKQLKRVAKSSSSLLKEGEETKKKTYSALVWSQETVSEESLKLLGDSKDLVIKQKTPIRVLHRRTLAVREKVIYSMHPEQLDAHHFKLELVTQAGTYIKEFVHGDFGRTQPNIGTLLGCDADILSLDVLEVQLQWPPTQ